MQKKIFATYMVLIFIGIFLTASLTLQFVRKSYMENVEERLISSANLIEHFIEEKAYDKSFNALDFSKYAKDYAKEIGGRVTFIDQEGNVLGDSEIHMNELDKVENHLYRPEVKSALEGKIGKDQRKSKTTDVDYVYIGMPISIKEAIKGVIRLAFPLTKIEKIYYQLFENVFIAVVCGLVVTVLLGYRFVYKVTRPIKVITKFAKKIANGKFDERVYIKSQDEIGLLADTFNMMAQKLDDTVSEIRDKNTKLQSALTSMNEALFAVDKSLKIILINPVAKALFHIENEEVYGEHILKVIRNNKLHEVLEDILKNNRVGEREIIIDYPDTKILKLYTNFIRLDMDPNRVIGVIALIQDVTQMRKLENMRKDFVANVSHELKTPLTSISGFIETLKSGAMEHEKFRKRFLDIIDIETERLTRLIDDLLTLSSIENHKIASKKQEICIRDVMKAVNVMAYTLAKQKNISYEVEIEGQLPSIYGNIDWFKQMVLNLVENAVKYTNEGGVVKVSIYTRYEYVFIVVKDTGVGIPKEDLPRLFERFYRVDKARSRDVGGTGLGLAIVKHIVLSFGGSIKVNSQSGKGSEFIVRIPVREKSN